jgi:hypothetical protein
MAVKELLKAGIFLADGLSNRLSWKRLSFPNMLLIVSAISFVVICLLIELGLGGLWIGRQKSR